MLSCKNTTEVSSLSSRKQKSGSFPTVTKKTSSPRKKLCYRPLRIHTAIGIKAQNERIRIPHPPPLCDTLLSKRISGEMRVNTWDEESEAIGKHQ